MLRQFQQAHRQWPVVIFLLVGLLVCPTLATAQAQEDERTKSLNSDARDQKEQVPKAESEVRNALREVQRLTAAGLTTSSTAKVIERLQKALGQVNDDTNLSAERRQALVRMLKDRIRVLQMEGSDEEDSQSRESKGKVEEDARATDQLRMLRLRASLQKLIKENKMGEASNSAAKPTRDRVGNPAAEATNRTTETSRQLTANRQAQNERNRSLTRALREVDQVATVPKDDVNYPADWKERTKNRTDNPVPMTDKEKAIFRTLKSTITVRFKDSRFEDVIEYIRTATGLRITMNKDTLDEANVSYDSTVSGDLKGVTVRFLLRKVLADKGLTFIIRNEAVEVVTPKFAKTLLVTRTYYVGDLAECACGLFSNEQAGMFMNMIQTSMDPKSWKENGGEGTISYNPATRSVTIKQSAEFHGVLSSGLR